MHVLLRRAEKNMVSMIFYDFLRQGANAVQLCSLILAQDNCS